MRIKIESDVFNIINRIKEIDENYYIVYNTNSKKFEVHNSGNVNSYCLTIPYKNLDVRTIELIHKTAIRNYDKVIKQMDEENERLQEKEINKAKEINDYKIREVLKYSNKNKVDKAFKTIWL